MADITRSVRSGDCFHESTGKTMGRKRTARQMRESGTLYVVGSCLGPAERDPTTGNIESGPHVTPGGPQNE